MFLRSMWHCSSVLWIAAERFSVVGTFSSLFVMDLELT